MELHSASTTAADHHKGKRCQVELKYKVFRGRYGRLYYDGTCCSRHTVRPASVLRDDHQQKLRHSKIEIQSFIPTLLLLLNIIKEGGVK